MTDQPVERPAAILNSIIGDEHVKLYRETNGEQGYIWNGAPIILVTTKGRKSGEARTIPIIFTQYGDSWVIMASRGGSPTHPAWYLNVLDDPKVTVQVKGDIYEAVARTAPEGEREKIWAEAIKVWPRYDVYQAATTRQIPVVVLDPVRKLNPA